MRRQRLWAVLGTALCMAATGTISSAASGAQRHKSRHPASVKAGPLATVAAFEQAYERKDKRTMLMKLMVPTTDLGALEKRYQWLRGYGPHDMPGTKHPPILFESAKGSFVPTAYQVIQSAPFGPTRYKVTVKEEGTYRDEDGKYNVRRVRQFTLTSYKGKWYVMDYVLKENPEDLGFYCDDISDKMTPLGK